MDEPYDCTIKWAARNVVDIHSRRETPITDGRFRENTMKGQMQDIYLTTWRNMGIRLKAKDLAALWEEHCLHDYKRHMLVRKHRDLLRSRDNLNRRIRETARLIKDFPEVVHGT